MDEIYETQQWRETIEELKKEQLAEGVRDFLKNFFSKKKPLVPPTPTPTPPTLVVPSPIASKKYIDQLNEILNRNQQALVAYVNTLRIRILKRNMEEFDFTQIPSRVEKRKPLDVQPDITPISKPTFSSSKAPNLGIFPAPVKSPPTVPIKIRKKSDLPPNSIFESQSREWSSRISGLEKVMTDAYKDVLNFLLQIAKDSKYVPKNSTDIKVLIREMKNFSILDKKTIYILRTKLIGFLMTYRRLEGYVKFFKQTQQTQAAVEKKAAGRHIP